MSADISHYICRVNARYIPGSKSIRRNQYYYALTTILLHNVVASFLLLSVVTVNLPRISLSTGNQQQQAQYNEDIIRHRPFHFLRPCRSTCRGCYRPEVAVAGCWRTQASPDRPDLHCLQTLSLPAGDTDRASAPVTRQFPDKPTRGQASCRLGNSPKCFMENLEIKMAYSQLFTGLLHNFSFVSLYIFTVLKCFFVVWMYVHDHVVETIIPTD